VEFTKIILTKVKDFFQLVSHKHESFSDLGFPSTMGLACGFLSHS
jgi:hypothetical protein